MSAFAETPAQYAARQAAARALAATMTEERAYAVLASAKPLSEMTPGERAEYVAANMVVRDEI